MTFQLIFTTCLASTLGVETCDFASHLLVCLTSKQTKRQKQRRERDKEVSAAVHADSTIMWVDKYEGSTKQKDTQHVCFILQKVIEVWSLFPCENVKFI